MGGVSVIKYYDGCGQVRLGGWTRPVLVLVVLHSLAVQTSSAQPE